jgi:hypothetical protein
MDSAGARALRDRIEQRVQWQQAPSVRAGRQPWDDPDADRLESFGEGLRLYTARQRLEIQEGLQKKITTRLSKRLVDGAWEDEVTVEDVETLSATVETVLY